MSAEVNIHGLKRGIPADVMRQVRQECGFGCVLCGRLPFKYDHFDPEWADAKEHRPEGIALLCGDCETQRTRKLIGINQVRLARAAPFNMEPGRDPFWGLRLGSEPVEVVFGGNRARNSDRNILFEINGVPLFGVERDGDAWVLLGSLCDDQGRASLKFEGSEIVARRGQWDITLIGQSLTVRSSPGNVVAELVLDGERRLLELRRLRMSLANGWRIEGTAQRVSVMGPRGETYTLGGNTFDGFGGNLISLAIPELGVWENWVAPNAHRAKFPQYKDDVARRVRRKAQKASRKANRR